MDKLTVKKLIDKLSEFNPDAEISFMYENLPHPLILYGWFGGDDNPEFNTKKVSTEVLFTSDIDAVTNDQDR